MENTTSKNVRLEPMLVKLAIPLALSAAGSVWAMIMAKSPLPTSSNGTEANDLKPILGEDEIFHSQNSASPPSLKEGESSEAEDKKPKVEEVILELTSRVEELERKEDEIERQFIRYQKLKERETLLVELRNTLVVDMAHISFLEREIMSMVEENKRYESLVSEYLGVSEQLEGQKSENKLLEREVKGLKKKLKEQSRVIREKNLKSQNNKAELWINNEEMETKKKMIEKLGDEVRELKMHQLNQSQEEDKASPKFETEAERSVTIEDFNKLSNEFNQLKDAFSKHELSSNHEQKQKSQKENHEEAERNQELKQEINGKALDKSESLSNKTNSPKPKLLQMISRAGSNEKMKRKIRAE